MLYSSSDGRVVLRVCNGVKIMEFVLLKRLILNECFGDGMDWMVFGMLVSQKYLF